MTIARGAFPPPPPESMQILSPSDGNGACRLMDDKQKTFTKMAENMDPISSATSITTPTLPQAVMATTAPTLTTTAGSSVVSGPLSSTGMAMGTPTLLTISNGSINIKPAGAASSCDSESLSKSDDLTGQTVGTLVRANVPTIGTTFPRFPILQQQPAVNLRIPNPLNFRVAPRGAMMLNTGAMHPGMAQVLPQVLPQGTKIVTPQLNNPTQVSQMNPQTLMVNQGQPLKISKFGMTLPVATPQGIPMPTSVALTVPIQMAVPITAVPAQGTIATMTSLGAMTLTNTTLAAPLQMPPQPRQQVATLPMVSAASAGERISMGMPGSTSTSPAVTSPVMVPSIPITSATAVTLPPPTPPQQEPPVTEDKVSETPTPMVRKVTEHEKTDSTDKKPSQDPKSAGPSETGESRRESVGDSDFDPMKAMEWDNGIGALPGSNLKFRINEFGLMEVVTDDLECNETLEGLKEGHMTKTVLQQSEASTTVPKQEPVDTGPAAAMSSTTSATATISSGAPYGEDETKLPEDVCQCENCGVYGMVSEFCGGGRFCSKTCVGQYASKRASMKKPSGDNKVKKAKKRRLVNGEDTGDLKMIKMEDDDAQRLLTGTISTKKTKGFSWSTFLEQTKSVGAAPKLFKDPFPCSKNGFKVGTKLEGIDTKHPSLYCVLTVAEVRGYRVRLHFDGYSECYDYWTNADSPFIFSLGWAEKNGKKLQPPKGFTSDIFNWTNYLKLSKAQPAPKHLFNSVATQSVTPHGFRFGMKLEAVDKKNAMLTCVATVADVLGDRILIHFDGWEDSYDYWCDPSSPYIHPVGWCQENGRALSPPNDWPDIEGFTWEDYLRTTKSSSVPARAFKNRQPHGFEIGMKVEAVDRRNPILIRVATVAEVKPHCFLLHFDGWSEIYDYWVDDDCSDVHPPSWCAKTSYPLTPPASELSNASGPGGCPTPGCTGVGHIKGAKYLGHYSSFGCPYSQLNMNKETALQDRLGTSRSESVDVAIRKVIKSIDYSALLEIKKCPTPNCDGSGHITGKYSAHHKISGCPLADKNLMKVGRPPSVNGDSTPTPSPTKPLCGPGSGRGRKKHKLLKEYKQQKALKGQWLPQGVVDGNDVSSQLLHGIHQSVFMSSMVTNPVKDLPLCWDQHSKLLPGVTKYQMRDVSSWTISQVADFVETLPGCKEQAKVFQEEQIDGEAFLLLTQTDIVKIMIIKLGPALKIYNSILMFKSSGDI